MLTGGFIKEITVLSKKFLFYIDYVLLKCERLENLNLSKKVGIHKFIYILCDENPSPIQFQTAMFDRKITMFGNIASV